MHRLLLMSLAAVLVSACGSRGDSRSVEPQSVAVLGPQTQEALDRYAARANAFIAALDAGAQIEELSAYADELVAISEQVLPDFLVHRPQCSEYLQASLALKDTWQDLSVDEIEDGYHKDGVLPKMEDAACYHMKDLIVHPITALAIVTDDPANREHAKHEIEEVVAHVTVVKATR